MNENPLNRLPGRHVTYGHVQGEYQSVGRVISDVGGATAAEYALVLAVVGASIAMATVTLSQSTACSIERSASTIAGEDQAPDHRYGRSDPNGKAKGHRSSTC